MALSFYSLVLFGDTPLVEVQTVAFQVVHLSGGTGVDSGLKEGVMD